MKIIFPLLIGLILILSFKSRDDLYQVITAHPHDVNDLKPFIDTVHQSGRLWVVRLRENAPHRLYQFLKTLSGDEKSFIPQFDTKTHIDSRHDHAVRFFIESVDKENIKKDVENLSGYKTRVSGSKENQLAVLSVLSRLKSFGYDVRELCHAQNLCNIVAEKKGELHAEEVIMVMAHIDSVGGAYAGADDNASGTAVLIEMAKVLKDYSNKKTIRFYVSNSEEQGLIGSSYYAKLLAAENGLKNLSLVINMDMVGYNSDGLVELETEPGFKNLANWYAGVAAQFTQLKTKITLGAWGSDHVPFLKRGVPSILTIENWETKTPCYHASCDTPSTLNYDYAAEIGRLNLAAVILKDQT